LHGKYILSIKSSIMSQTPQPLIPIVIHPGFSIRLLGEHEASKSFFCLDSAEFGDGLSNAVATIRSETGFTIPIIVIGLPARDHRELHQEANQAEEAGAIYFERPTGEIKIDDLASQICKELTRIHDLPESLSGHENAPIKGDREQGNEHSFYADAPFRLSDVSLQILLDRLKMRDVDPRKDD
jgi:hypothetical protein